ncbi:MAG: hypothetical protein AUI10_09145 [Actinobacteria bacterium 13_2_20CM_2_72_6]|nr:MAG: hypothetical protein AUI10_09145 [Actinobacteria bacterium 13_2_20CM_2_72_6]
MSPTASSAAIRSCSGTSWNSRSTIGSIRSAITSAACSHSRRNPRCSRAVRSRPAARSITAFVVPSASL